MTDPILPHVGGYYGSKFEEHGPTPAGVDWNSAASQEVRFGQLLRVRDDRAASFSLNDFGCGYGALVPYLESHGRPDSYCGFDIVDQMLAQARADNVDRPWVRFVASAEDLPVSDYTVASGVFNVKLHVDDESWNDYVLATLAELAAVSRLGFAFNMLTTYSDPERMRDDLYYADPCFFFDHCKRTYSRNVGLLHDYDLYEFTMVVRNNE
jgi:methyltransferase family protein